MEKFYRLYTRIRKLFWICYRKGNDCSIWPAKKEKKTPKYKTNRCKDAFDWLGQWANSAT